MTSNIKYTLTVKQQPQKARLCSFKEKVDRRPLDPPPIIQVHQSDNLSFNDYQNSANFFLHATLIDASNHYDLHLVNGNKTIAGSVAQSLHKLKDIDNTEGAFFIFSDISVRIEGVFKLKFTLFQIKGMDVEQVCSVYTDPFRVYSPKSFPGMSESTELTRSFSDQGVRIRVRKETRTAANSLMKRKFSETNLNPRIGGRKEYFYSSGSSSPKEEEMRFSGSNSSHVMSMQNLLSPEEPPSLPPLFLDHTNTFPKRTLPYPSSNSLYRSVDMDWNSSPPRSFAHCSPTLPYPDLTHFLNDKHPLRYQLNIDFHHNTRSASIIHHKNFFH